MAPPSQPTRLGSTKMQQNLESTVTWLSPYISIQGCLKQADSDVPALAAQLSPACCKVHFQGLFCAILSYRG